MNIPVSAALVILATVLALAFTGWLIPVLRRRALLDQPNERSSHVTPTLFGGGLAVLAVLLVMWLLIFVNPLDVPALSGAALSPVVIAGALALAAVSWIDDLWGLSQVYRLVVQFAVAGGAVYLSGIDPGAVFQGLVPAELDALLSVVLLVWFINLFNFMDGIDGITSVESISISLGLLVLVATGNWVSGNWILASLLAGAMAGFLWWNWHPAKIFLGDVGSVPLGFLLGWLLLDLAAAGHWAATLILPLYYLVDATLTLFARLLRGEKFWQSHKQHYYQQAVVKGYSHAGVSLAIAIGNIFLIGLSLTSVHAPVSGLVGGCAVVFVMLLYFKHTPAE